jgi:hypothetical protein
MSEMVAKQLLKGSASKDDVPLIPVRKTKLLKREV